MNVRIFFESIVAPLSQAFLSICAIWNDPPQEYFAQVAAKPYLKLLFMTYSEGLCHVDLRQRQVGHFLELCWVPWMGTEASSRPCQFHSDS